METMNENGREYLCITTHECYKKRILEKMQGQASGLYETYIHPVEANVISNKRSDDQVEFTL